MDELTIAFAQARYGEELTKAAFGDAIMQQFQRLAQTPELSDNARRLRDVIEKSIREEQRMRSEATSLVQYGKKRLTDPARMGGTGTLALDALRSLIPGLSISASADAGSEKAAKDPEERAPGRLFDVAHALTAAGGAGAGLAAQKGLFGGVYGRDVAEGVMGGAGPLREAILKELMGAGAEGAVPAAVRAAAQAGDIGLAAQKHTPFINRITRLFSGPSWRRRFAGLGAAPTAAGARATMLNDVLAALGAGGRVSGEQAAQARRTVGRLPQALHNVLRTGRLQAAGGQAGRVMPGGWKGALIGALLTTAPFAIYRLLKTRKLRERGGTAAESAAEKAEQLLSQAGELGASRKKLFAQGA